MENDLDLTLRLDMPVPTIDTDLSLQHIPVTPNQGVSVDGGWQVSNSGGGSNGRRRGMFGGEIDLNDEGARNNHNVNVRVYNSVFQRFAGLGDTLNFAPHPVQPYAVPPRVNPSRNEYVMIDVPARRAWRNNNSLVMANANANENATTNARRRCREMLVMRTCTNINCNTNETPMWRKGPLGPKTLCNACGIKYRKEEKRKANKNNRV